MDLRFTGRRRTALGFILAALLLSPAAVQAGQERIQFTGRLVAPAAPLSVAGVHVLSDGSAAVARRQLLSVAVATGDVPELLRYFTGYARGDTRLIVTSYE